MPIASRESLLNQARQCVRGGDLVEAERICGRLLGLDKRDGWAHYLLGQVSYYRGEQEQATTCFERAARAQPKNPAFLINLAKTRTAAGELRRALGLYDKALKLSPDDAQALAWKAMTLERMGEADEARRLLEPSVQAGKADGEMALAFASLEHKAGRHREAIELAGRFVDDAAVAPTVRRNLGFLIGSAHERLGEHARAFEAYERANRQPNDIGVGADHWEGDSHAAMIDALMQMYTADNLADFPRARNASEVPVFVTGMPRSGTTLVEQIIHAHPRAWGAGELTDFDRAERSVNEALQAHAAPATEAGGGISQKQWDELGRRYLDRLRALSRDADRVVDKNLRAYLQVGLISLLLPKARIIHCRRDPMDTCFSCYASPLWPLLHPYASDLADLGLQHRLHDRMMQHWKDATDLRFLDVSYEALVADPEPEIRRIIGFLDLEWDDACLRSHESDRVVRTLSHDQVRRPIYRSSVGRHEPFRPFLDPLAAALDGS